MVAMTQLIPEDPKEQASVLEVLREHPELGGFIAKASAKAEELFPGAMMHLDTVRYDDWDPPVSLIIQSPLPMVEHRVAVNMYIHWLTSQPDYDDELISVFPQWWGNPDRAR